ncbi:hypothetical protein LCGC14_2065530 [marine sediment metagenome]|uniref:Uncharacterized protein n=1 Tax=marine sediment metagenome TaxID=412755 RepID=A0A0F9EJU6_9ZZZZ
MTLDQAHEIVKEAVVEHGPAEATQLLIQRAEVDREFSYVMAQHGAEIFAAVIESLTATVH